MDTTETYIKMRLVAVPDLGMGTPMGFSINWQSEAILIDEKGDWYYSTKDDVVQLERQDQLQEMVIGGCDPYPDPSHSLLEDFWKEIHIDSEDISEWNTDYIQFTSMEQLWLAFLLAEKYGKCWDGDDWIVQK